MDIENTSLIFIYNTLSNYKNQDKYFDWTWENNGAMNNRIIPFKFEGYLITQFDAVFDADRQSLLKKDMFLDIIREIKYLSENYMTKEYKDNTEYDFSIKDDRWRANFNTLKKWIAVFSQNQEIYNTRVNELYKCHKQYLSMVGQQNTDSNSIITPDVDQSSSFEFEMNDEEAERVCKYLKKYEEDKGIDINTLKAACLVSEEKITEMLSRGSIFENKPGRVRLL